MQLRFTLATIGIAFCLVSVAGCLPTLGQTSAPTLCFESDAGTIIEFRDLPPQVMDGEFHPLVIIKANGSTRMCSYLLQDEASSYYTCEGSVLSVPLDDYSDQEDIKILGVAYKPRDCRVTSKTGQTKDFPARHLSSLFDMSTLVHSPVIDLRYCFGEGRLRLEFLDPGSTDSRVIVRTGERNQLCTYMPRDEHASTIACDGQLAERIGDTPDDSVEFRGITLPHHMCPT